MFPSSLENQASPESVLPPSLPERWIDGLARQALDNPSRTAVICGTRSLTYENLISRSNQIANHLRARGIGKGDFVGIGLHRSLELLPAMLGIVKSGAVYIPIDPSYPAARIGQMIASANFHWLVTQNSLTGQFSGIPLICIDDEAISSESSAAMETEIGRDDQIYAIFTSGSTGQPKAASVYHRGFGNLLHWYTTELELGRDDRTLIITSPSFDLTQKNFFAPLITGGTLILDDAQTFDLSRITQLIREAGITVINCAPSAFYPLLEAAANDSYATLVSLRCVVLGGEPISIHQVGAWLKHSNCHAEIINTYGPTECTDICTYHKLHRSNIDDYEFIPLGREISNVTVSVVDESLTPLPDGELGELCIAGAGLGAGYLNDPQRTAEAFRDSVYRTGDLARRLPSGILEFCGRADHQVKVNGFRIELGEIEITLNRHSEVRESAVIANGNRLTAYFRGSAAAEDLRQSLAAHLPAYMVPTEFIQIDQFPLTPNGKVDRRALAATVRTSSAPAETINRLESRILALWSEVLGHPVSDPTANFFDLGGNSIHLARVHVKLMKLKSSSFPILSLFTLPTARSIAEFLTRKSSAATNSSALERARRAQASFSNYRPPLSK